MKGLCLLIFVLTIFHIEGYGQKLKQVVVYKQKGDIYSKEVFSIIKRGEHKGKRHGSYTYSKYADEITGNYLYGLKHGKWKYNSLYEFYTNGHLDSISGRMNNRHILIYFDKNGDTLQFEEHYKLPRFIAKQTTENSAYLQFAQSGISKKISGDTSRYFTAYNELIGVTIKDKKEGSWHWKTAQGKAISHYHQDKKVGTQSSFYNNGNTLSTQEFDSSGTESGFSVYFYPNGDTAAFYDLTDGYEENPGTSIYPKKTSNRLPNIRGIWSQRASFIGGEELLQLYIAMHQKYPIEAYKKNIQGSVTIQFNIDELGEIQNPKILYSDHPDFSVEAERLIKSSSYYWNPSVKDGFPAAMTFKIDINFAVH